MEISYFREFMVLAKTQNFWAASEELFMGESSLSKHIKSMEKQLGAPLFYRTSRKVSLTEFGERLLPIAEEIGKLQYEYEKAAYNFLHEGEVVLRVGAIPALPQYGIIDILTQFQREFPKVEVITTEEDSPVLFEMLLNHELELAFIRHSDRHINMIPEKEARIIKALMTEDRLVAVLPKNHALAGRESIALTDLKDERFALIKKNSLPYNVALWSCRDAGFEPEIVFTSHNRDSLLDMVTVGSCVSLLFEHHVNVPVDSVMHLDPPFSVVPIEPEIRTYLYLCRLKDRELSDAAEHFMRYCVMKQQEGI